MTRTKQDPAPAEKPGQGPVQVTCSPDMAVQPSVRRSCGNLEPPAAGGGGVDGQLYGVGALRWQGVGAVSQSVFERYVAESENRGEEISTAGLLRFSKRLTNEALRASGAAVAPLGEDDDAAADLDEVHRGAAVGCTVENLAAPSAGDALAFDQRVEDVLDRLDALSIPELALVADAMADRWGITPISPAPDEEADEQSQAHCVDITASASSQAQEATIEPVEMPSMREEFDGNADKSALKKGDSDGEQDFDHHIPGFTDDSIGLKYYPTADTDPYNLHGRVWIYGALEIEMQHLLIVAKQKQFPKPFIDGTLERISQLFEMLEGQGVKPEIHKLLRRYGYGDVVDQAITRTDVSGDPMPLSEMGTNP